MKRAELFLRRGVSLALAGALAASLCLTTPPAAAEEGEEHLHTRACYLLCGENHVHTEDCGFDGEAGPFCGLEEGRVHVHSADGYRCEEILICEPEMPEPVLENVSAELPGEAAENLPALDGEIGEQLPPDQVPEEPQEPTPEPPQPEPAPEPIPDPMPEPAPGPEIPPDPAPDEGEEEEPGAEEDGKVQEPEIPAEDSGESGEGEPVENIDEEDTPAAARPPHQCPEGYHDARYMRCLADWVDDAATFASGDGATTWEELKAALEAGGTVTLAEDISQTGADIEITKAVTLDLKGHVLNCTAPLRVTKGSLTIQGTGTIQGNHLDVLISVANAELTIDGGTITNPGGRGIALNASRMNLRGGMITGCGKADLRGGGIYADNSSGVNIIGGSVCGNTGLTGGGVYILNGSSVNMTGGAVSDNSALNGGGLYLMSRTIGHFTGGVISKNTATAQGGGIYVNAANAEIGGTNRIAQNSAVNHGGGVYAFASTSRVTVGGHAEIRENTTGDPHPPTDCTATDEASIRICANIASSAEGRYTVKDDAYVGGWSRSDFEEIVRQAEGTLSLTENVTTDHRIMIEKDLVLDLNGSVITYGGAGTLFAVKSGVEFTIKSGGTSAGHTLQYSTHTGAASITESGKITANGAEALIAVEPGGTLRIEGGGLENTGGKHVILVNGRGTVQMSGGYITGGNSPGNGGGISAENGIIELSGGVIAGNKAAACGGGVYTSNLTMSGGTVSNNAVEKMGDAPMRGGGGIYVTEDKSGKAQYEMILTGGTICGNSSAHTGGGIFVDVNVNAMVKGSETSAVYIVNNQATGNHGFSGGGIFVEHPVQSTDEGKLYVDNALITENTAVYGGGVAGCGTSSVNVFSIEGVAIYDNTITASGNSEQKRLFSQDLYCDGSGEVDSLMLGGVRARWEGRSDEAAGTPVIINEGFQFLNHFYLQSKLSEADKESIEEKARVFIRGNSSSDGGGGIGGNGYIRLGEGPAAPENPDPPSASATGSLTVRKSWNDAGHEGERPDSVAVQLKRNGEPCGEAVTLAEADGWSYTWDGLPLADSEDNSYTYSVEEVVSGGGYAVEYSAQGVALKADGSQNITVTNAYNPPDDPKEDPKDPPKEDPKDPPKEDPKDPPKEDPKDPPKEDPKDPPKEDPKDPPKEDPKDPPKEDPKDPPKEDPKDPPEEESKEPSEEETEDPSIEETPPEELEERPEYPAELPDPNAPDSPETITILEDGVPLTYRKVWDPITEEYLYILEDEVPLFGFDVPETGDKSWTGLWAALCLTGLASGAAIAASGKKRREEDERA